ncbi:MAG: hypothetical protein ACKV19_23440 [Verrucomicrobiales bacterium]
MKAAIDESRALLSRTDLSRLRLDREATAEARSEAGASGPGPGRRDPVVDADLAMRTVMVLQSLLDRVLGEREAEEQRRRPVLRKMYTPRSHEPLSLLATPPAMPIRVRRRSLHFSCPCCGRETVVVRKQAGARVRCPHCRAAVTAPIPSCRRSAHNLERDIESVLHPESFVAPVRPMPPPLVRWVMKEPVLILALAALVPFTALLIMEVPSVMEKSKGGVPSTVVQVAPILPSRKPADGAADRSVALVQKYLAAPTAHAKSAYVRDPERVRLLMLTLAAQEPDLFGPADPVEVKAGGLGHYADPENSVPFTPVVAQFRDGTARTFYVEHSADGDSIEWESSIGYSEPLAIARPAKGPTPAACRAIWRVEAAPDDYFNRAFADESRFYCLKIARADRPQESFWAYAPKDSEVGAALQRIWTESPHELVQRLTVTVEAGPAAARTRQVSLTAVHHAGWRSPDHAGALVAGRP